MTKRYIVAVLPFAVLLSAYPGEFPQRSEAALLGPAAPVTGVDLEVASLGLPEGPVARGSDPAVEFTIIIRNTGTEPLDPSSLPRWGDVPVVPFSLSMARMNDSDALQSFGGWGIPITEVLHPNDMVTYKFPLSDDPRWLPEGLPTADWVIAVELDPGHEVPEANDGNNYSYSLEFTVVSDSGTLPNPALDLRYGTRRRPGKRGDLWDDYHLSVTNWSAFPDRFGPYPPLMEGLQSCPNRMSVSVHDAATGRQIDGYCALEDPAELADLVLSLPAGHAPSPVFVLMTDQVLGISVRSNTLRLPAL